MGRGRGTARGDPGGECVCGGGGGAEMLHGRRCANAGAWLPRQVCVSVNLGEPWAVPAPPLYP